MMSTSSWWAVRSVWCTRDSAMAPLLAPPCTLRATQDQSQLCGHTEPQGDRCIEGCGFRRHGAVGPPLFLLHRHSHTLTDTHTHSHALTRTRRHSHGDSEMQLHGRDAVVWLPLVLCVVWEGDIWRSGYHSS